MPPVLISSAAAGKKAAPKGAVRRRPAAPGPAAPAQTTPSAPTSVAPQSPPPTQPPVVEEPVEERNVQEKQPTPAPPEPTSDAADKQTTEEPVVQPVSLPTTDVEARDVPKPSPAQVETQQGADTVESQADTVAPASEAVPEAVSEPAAPAVANPQASLQSHAQPQGEAIDEAQPAPEVTQPSEATEPTPAPKTAKKRTRNEASSSVTSKPPKRAKRSSARSNATVQAQVQAEDQAAAGAISTPAEGGDASNGPTSPQPQIQTRRKSTRKVTSTVQQKKTRSKAKSAATVQNSDDEDEAAPTPESPQDEEGSEEPPPRKPKQVRKKKQVRVAEPAEAGGEGGEGGDAVEQGGQDRDSDESDPELHEIDPNTLSMWNLSHDTRYGKVSERGKKMAEIDWEEVAEKRREAAQAIVNANNQQDAPAGEVIESVEGPDATTEPQEGEAEQTQPAQSNGANSGKEAFLVDADGNIVLDEDTVRHDATAQAMEAAETGAIEDVNDLAQTLNRTTWINNNRRDPTDRVPMWKWKSDPWSEQDTDRFYDALMMFGSDFFIISKMFPGKTRRMIKAKFNREEKLDPERIDNAMTGKTARAMDLEHYSRETGRDMSVFMKYDGVEHAQSLINASMKDKHETMAAAAQEEAALAAEKTQRERHEKKEKNKSAKRARQKRSIKGGGTMGGGPDEVAAE